MPGLRNGSVPALAMSRLRYSRLSVVGRYTRPLHRIDSITRQANDRAAWHAPTDPRHAPDQGPTGPRPMLVLPRPHFVVGVGLVQLGRVDQAAQMFAVFLA